MGRSAEQFVIDVMSGRARGPIATVMRSALAAAEPIYTAAVQGRNRRYDRGAGVRRSPRPVISVGNVTAGGTGKTPVVRWLCERLRQSGHHPAVLLRGYKAADGVSDEARLLEHFLGGGERPVFVKANPSRWDAGNEVLREHPEVDVFVLDDGFQHRRLARDFDLVLVNAVEPFGFGHVHPRGLLREPLSAFRRADAVLITRAAEIEGPALRDIESRVREFKADVPIYRVNHVHIGFRTGSRPAAAPPDQDVNALRDRRAFVFCALGSPESFCRQVASAGTVVGSRFFSDHHAYSPADVNALISAATAARADVLVTTEKDWTKLDRIDAAIRSPVPIWRAELAVQFDAADEAALMEQISGAIRQRG